MTDATITAAQSAPASDLARTTPGEYLRKLREEKGHTHAAVGSALHLTVHYIKALESDEYGKLPGLTFVKGYLRAYARFLGADVDNVLARFDEHITGLLDAGKHTARVERSKRRQDQALRWAIGAGFVVVAGLVGGWWFMRDTTAPAAETVQRDAAAAETAQANASPESMASSAAASQASTYAPPSQQMPPAATGLGAAPTNVMPPVVALAGIGAPNGVAAATATVVPVAVDATTQAPQPVVPVSGTPLAVSPGADGADNGAATITSGANGARQVSLIGAGNDELRVAFVGNSWIEVDDGSNVRLYNDMLAAGDVLTIRGVAPFRVLLGDASQVQVTLNAAAVDISADVRADSTARLVLGAPAARTDQAVALPAATASDTPSEEVPQ